ncbi:MAG: HDOD domain-containing protein [Desulfobacter sp.]|nr:MAG: HDOD domain-containing protein [Desulfobacter sp.]
MKDTLVSEKTIALSIAHEILTTSVKIPAIPGNIRRIFKMVRQPEDKIDIPEFAKLVESDPGLFTRILQLANSQYYSGMEKSVTLRSAITRIGLKETVNTVCLQFYKQLLPRFPDIEGFSYTDFWAFSWACAVANRRLGHLILGMDVLPGDLYMAGMLQGLGKLLMAIHFPDQFSFAIARAQTFEHPLYEVERELFGTTDALVAAQVLKTWQLPVNICEGVGFSQMPDQAPPEYILIAGLTQFAYAIAREAQIGASGDGSTLCLAETFLGQNPNLNIAKKETQDALVKEILITLNGPGQSLVSGSKHQMTKLGKAARKERVDPVPKKARKKGVLGWVKSWLN